MSQSDRGGSAVWTRHRIGDLFEISVPRNAVCTPIPNGEPAISWTPCSVLLSISMKDPEFPSGAAPVFLAYISVFRDRSLTSKLVLETQKKELGFEKAVSYELHNSKSETINCMWSQVDEFDFQIRHYLNHHGTWELATFIAGEQPAAELSEIADRIAQSIEFICDMNYHDSIQFTGS